MKEAHDPQQRSMTSSPRTGNPQVRVGIGITTTPLHTSIYFFSKHFNHCSNASANNAFGLFAGSHPFLRS